MIQNILTENPQIQSTKRIIAKKKQFAREHGRNYKSGAEVHLRREIFNENYKSMMEHNARSAGQLKNNTLSFVGEIALSCIFLFFFYDWFASQGLRREWRPGPGR